MWKDGKFTIDGVEFLYEAKVFDNGGKCGINGGRILKLAITENKGPNPWVWDNVIVNYDKDWDIRPRTELEKKR